MGSVLSVAPISFRYLLILFRDAPVEVWAMTKTPIMVSFVNLVPYLQFWELMFAIVQGGDKFEILSINLIYYIHCSQDFFERNELKCYSLYHRKLIFSSLFLKSCS